MTYLVLHTKPDPRTELFLQEPRVFSLDYTDYEVIIFKKALNTDHLQTNQFYYKSIQLTIMYLWDIRKNNKNMYLYKKVLSVISSVTLQLEKLFWFISPAFNSWTIWGNVLSRSIFNKKMNAFLLCFNCIFKNWASWGTTHFRRLMLGPKNSPVSWFK